MDTMDDMMQQLHELFQSMVTILSREREELICSRTQFELVCTIVSCNWLDYVQPNRRGSKWWIAMHDKVS